MQKSQFFQSVQKIERRGLFAFFSQKIFANRQTCRFPPFRRSCSKVQKKLRNKNRSSVQEINGINPRKHSDDGKKRKLFPQSRFSNLKTAQGLTRTTRKSAIIAMILSLFFGISRLGVKFAPSFSDIQGNLSPLSITLRKLSPRELPAEIVMHPNTSYLVEQLEWHTVSTKFFD